MTRTNIAIIAFSFGLREGVEPSVCNHRLAKVVKKILTASDVLDPPLILAQWEVAICLAKLEVPPDLMIDQVERITLTDEEVMNQATLFMLSRGITRVLIVAHPFLQLGACKKLARQAGFKIIRYNIKGIGFDPRSDQTHARGPFAHLWHMILKKFFGSLRSVLA